MKGLLLKEQDTFVKEQDREMKVKGRQLRGDLQKRSLQNKSKTAK